MKRTSGNIIVCDDKDSLIAKQHDYQTKKEALSLLINADGFIVITSCQGNYNLKSAHNDSQKDKFIFVLKEILSTLENSLQ